MYEERSPSVETYAHRLVEQRDAMAREQLRVVGAVIPELAGRDIARLAHAAAVANLELMAGALTTGRWSDLTTPPAVGDLVRRLAWDGVELDLLARAYRIGQEWLYEDIRSYCRATCTSADDAVAMLGELGQAALRFSDLSTTSVLAQYKHEREELGKNAHVKRARVVRAILDKEPVDLIALERTLGYGFSGPHTALRIAAARSREGVAGDAPREVATAVVEVLQSPQALVIEDRPDSVKLWVRCRIDRARTDGLALGLRGRSGIQIALGSPAIGVEGFRRTSQQADRASVVGPYGGDGLVVYRDVALVALLLENTEAAQSFMVDELGDLTWPSELNDALRATLRAFLAHQCRFVPTARATFLHRNTIAERLRRIETLLGHAVTDRAPELDAALRLHAYFSAEQRMPPTPGAT